VDIVSSTISMISLRVEISRILFPQQYQGFLKSLNFPGVTLN
jgi:hypothetical protein